MHSLIFLACHSSLAAVTVVHHHAPLSNHAQCHYPWCCTTAGLDPRSPAAPAVNTRRKKSHSDPTFSFATPPTMLPNRHPRCWPTIFFPISLSNTRSAPRRRHCRPLLSNHTEHHYPPRFPPEPTFFPPVIHLICAISKLITVANCKLMWLLRII